MLLCFYQFRVFLLEILSLFFLLINIIKDNNTLFSCFHHFIIKFSLLLLLLYIYERHYICCQSPPCAVFSSVKYSKYLPVYSILLWVRNRYIKQQYQYDERKKSRSFWLSERNYLNRFQNISLNLNKRNFFSHTNLGPE